MNNKLRVIIYGCVDVYGGYPANARDKVKAIIELYKDKWDIKIISCNWGGLAHNFINDNIEEWGWLNEYILPNSQLNYKPDIMVWITIPPEANIVGKWNCLFTAGIETTQCTPQFLEGVNRMDLTIVPSNHAKKIFVDSKYTKTNKQTNQPEGTLELNKPIEVIFEGVNLNTYFCKNPKEVKSINLDEIEEDFAYLYLGHYIDTNGAPIGEDRKNVPLLIKCFLETFKNKKNKPALILKTQINSVSYTDRDEIIKRIKQIKNTVNSTDLPNIYLLHGDFTDQKINDLYSHSKVKAMISLTKGEGFGRPLLEFSLQRKPIIASGWSGQIDFLNKDFCCLIPGQLTQVHPAAANDWIMKEAKWFSPDLGQIGHYLTDVFENYDNYLEGAKRQAHYSKTNFSWEAMKTKIQETFDKYIPKELYEQPQFQPLVLPSAKTLSLPQLKQIN